MTLLIYHNRKDNIDIMDCEFVDFGPLPESDDGKVNYGELLRLSSLGSDEEVDFGSPPGEERDVDADFGSLPSGECDADADFGSPPSGEPNIDADFGSPPEDIDADTDPLLGGERNFRFTFPPPSSAVNSPGSKADFGSPPRKVVRFNLSPLLSDEMGKVADFVQFSKLTVVRNGTLIPFSSGDKFFGAAGLRNRCNFCHRTDCKFGPRRAPLG